MGHPNNINKLNDYGWNVIEIGYGGSMYKDPDTTGGRRGRYNPDDGG